MAYPLARVQRNLRELTNTYFYKGWIPERFDEVADKKFSFVHVDVDLYQPTRDSVEFFFPRLVPGGMLVCDDYSSARCPGAYKAMRDYTQPIGQHIIHITSGQGVMIKREGTP